MSFRPHGACWSLESLPQPDRPGSPDVRPALQMVALEFIFVPVFPPSSHHSVRIHHILHCSFSPSLCALPCLLFDHAWLINGSLRTFSGPCGGMTLGVLLLAGSQHSTLTNKHSLWTGRQQHSSLGTCHLLRRQHRPCLSTLLHSCGTHTRRDMMLTHRLTFCLWTPTLSLFSQPYSAPGCIHPGRPAQFLHS